MRWIRIEGIHPTFVAAAANRDERVAVRSFTRPGRSSDAEGLVPLFASLSHPATAPQVRTRLERVADDPAYEHWGAEAPTGELVGFAAGHLLFPVEYDALAAQLIALVTAESARGQGVGSALCAEFEERAVQQGAPRVLLNSSAARTEAHVFSTRRGYTASGVRFMKSL
nr:GNAT family N-acetyltransferase [Nocardiopsis halophila]